MNNNTHGIDLWEHGEIIGYCGTIYSNPIHPTKAYDYDFHLERVYTKQQIKVGDCFFVRQHYLGGSKTMAVKAIRGTIPMISDQKEMTMLYPNIDVVLMTQVEKLVKRMLLE